MSFEKPFSSKIARQAVREDGHAITGLYLESGREIGLTNQSARSFLRRINALIGGEQTTFVVAGRPIAAMALVHFKQEVWSAQISAFIEDVFVSATTRRQGLGQAVLAHAIEVADDRGAQFASLNVNEQNSAALQLYETFGFCSGFPLNWGGGRELFMVLPSLSESIARRCTALDEPRWRQSVASDRDGVRPHE